MKERLRTLINSALLAPLGMGIFSFPSETRKEIGKRDGWTCQSCGRKFQDGWMVEAHHVLPEHEGGSQLPDNGIIFCLECHMKAHEEMGDESSAQLIEERLERTGGRTKKWLESNSQKT